MWKYGNFSNRERKEDINIYKNNLISFKVIMLYNGPVICVIEEEIRLRALSYLFKVMELPTALSGFEAKSI